MGRKLDTQNPFVFLALLATAFFFVAISLLGTIGLIAVLLLGESDNSHMLASIAFLTIILIMILLGVWNLVSSIKLIGDSEVKRLVGIIFRSLLILMPFGILWVIVWMK